MSDHTITLTPEQVAAIASGRVRLRTVDSQGYSTHEVELYEWAIGGTLTGVLAEPVLVALAQRVLAAEERGAQLSDYGAGLYLAIRAALRALDIPAPYSEWVRAGRLVLERAIADGRAAWTTDGRNVLAAKDARIAELEAVIARMVSGAAMGESALHDAQARVEALEAALRMARSHIAVEGGA